MLPAPRRPGRPKDPAKRAAILDAAWRLFIERGTASVGLEEVAAEAGVSRMTVYSHFGGRAELLGAVVERQGGRVASALDAVRPGEHGALRERLLAFARAYLRLVTRGDVLAFDGILRAGGASHPDLVRAFLAAGPVRLLGRVEDVLAGEGVAEPGAVARRLLSLLVGDLLLLDRYGMPPDLTEAEIEARAAAEVAFLLQGLRWS